MKIASCIIILTFAVYVDFVGCSSSHVGPSHVSPPHVGSNPRSYQKCECMNIDGYDILMKRDPDTKEILYIRLRDENTQWLTKETYMVHVIVQNPNLEFVAFASANTGRWLALTTMNDFHRRALRIKQAPVFRIANPTQLITMCDCLPDEDPIPVVSRSEPSFLPYVRSSEKTTPLERPHSRETTLPHARAHSSAGPSSPVNSTVRARSRSPSSGNSFSTIFGFKVEDLRLIRLTPNGNPNKTYELLKYTFPSDNRIHLRTTHNTPIPVPAEEQIVMAASNGDALAILEKRQRRPLLRGLYKPVKQPGIRAKINIHSGAVEVLTPEEIADSPLGATNGMPKNFKIFRVQTV